LSRGLPFGELVPINRDLIPRFTNNDNNKKIEEHAKLEGGLFMIAQ
jgi:hypothetical protein